MQGSLQIIALFRGKWCIESKFQHTNHTIHWRANLVTHVCKKSAFRKIGRLCADGEPLRALEVVLLDVVGERAEASPLVADGDDGLDRRLAQDSRFPVYEDNRDLWRAAGLPVKETLVHPSQLAAGPDSGTHGAFKTEWKTSDEINWRRNFGIWMRWVKTFHERGGLLTAGSDDGELGGVGLIRELELMQEAGIHPIDVVKVATTNAMQALGLKDYCGVRVGCRADLAVVNGLSDNLSILLGNGAGGFGPAANFAAGDGPNGVAVGDFNAEAVHDQIAIRPLDLPRVIPLVEIKLSIGPENECMNAVVVIDNDSVIVKPEVADAHRPAPVQPGSGDTLPGTGDGTPAPDPNDEYFLYQTLVGILPDRGAIEAMRNAGATHVMVHPQRMFEEGEATVRQLGTIDELELLAVGDGGMRLYRISRPKPPA